MKKNGWELAYLVTNQGIDLQIVEGLYRSALGGRLENSELPQYPRVSGAMPNLLRIVFKILIFAGIWRTRLVIQTPKRFKLISINSNFKRFKLISITSNFKR